MSEVSNKLLNEPLSDKTQDNSLFSLPNRPESAVDSAQAATKKIVAGSLLALAALSVAVLSMGFALSVAAPVEVVTDVAANLATNMAADGAQAATAALPSGQGLSAGGALQAAAASRPAAWQSLWGALGLVLMVLTAVRALWPTGRWASVGVVIGSLAAAACWLALEPAQSDSTGAAGFWFGVLALALLAALSVQRCAQFSGGWGDDWLAAATFGVWVLVFWQLLVTALGVPRVILPAPFGIGQALIEQRGILGQDFVQTVLKAVVTGWLMGCILGFLVAIAIDRQPFLQRGLLPIASLTSTVPLVAVAPITVMWFGFGWESKAAVVVLMTFFPMLVSTLAGLKAADKLEQELMFTYAASYQRTLLDLRLPSAFPHVVGALKVNASLALIGAIVAEYFGSPTSGLGFRISTEAAKMNMSLVWGAIVVSAVTGSVAYALLVKLERKLAFWHPSVRVR